MTSLASGQLSRAVLIGVSSFTDPDLYDLPSVTNNVDTLHGMLTHPDWWGIPLENCARIKDDVSAQRVRELLREAARSAEDVLLVYYAGHGLPLDPDDLVLATTHTRQKSPRDSGVPIDDIRDVFLSSRARTRVLVLDCCYSGRALERLGLDKATATLASVPATEPGNAAKADEFTEFGGHLIRVLRRGIDNQRNTLTLRAIADEIRSIPGAGRLARLQASQQAADIPLVHNRARPVDAHAGLAWTAVDQLAYVVQGVDAIAATIGRTIGPSGLASLIPADNTDNTVEEYDSTAAIARDFRLPRQSSLVDRGIGYVRELVAEVYRQVGDGGATAVVITRTLVDGVLAAIRNDEHLGEVLDGIRVAFAWAATALTSTAKPVDSHEHMVNVTASAARDRPLGEFVARAVTEAGRGGAVLVEDGLTTGRNSMSFVPGLRVESECVRLDLFTEPDRGEAVLESPFVMVEDDLTMDRAQELVQAGRSGVVFSATDNDDAIALIVGAKTAGDADLLVVRLPKHDTTSAQQIKALIRQGKRPHGGTTRRMPRKVLVTESSTLLVWASGVLEGNEIDLRPLPVIRVSAGPKFEQQNVRRLAEAAVSSTLAAMRNGGTVAGGGVALRDVARQLRQLPEQRHGNELSYLHGSQVTGVRIAADALTEPCYAMGRNARLDGRSMRSLTTADPGVGVDLTTSPLDRAQHGPPLVNMVEHGIVDAVAVLKIAMTEALNTTTKFTRLA
ncbi:hypothetical protein GCM10029964_017020 [Kibdelosporangium lantanae]